MDLLQHTLFRLTYLLDVFPFVPTFLDLYIWPNNNNYVLDLFLASWRSQTYVFTDENLFSAVKKKKTEGITKAAGFYLQKTEASLKAKTVKVSRRTEVADVSQYSEKLITSFSL